MMIIDAKPQLIPRDRRTGEKLHWQTTTMESNEQVYGSKAYGGWGRPDQK